MSLKINQNVLSLRTYGTLSETANRLEKSIQKLSSGLKINSASDDAAGLAISEKMRRQVRGLDRSVLNAQDGISMIQTAEGAMNESHSILQRMRELATQSANDTLTSNDRLEIQKEVVQLKDDINRIANNTEFNTKKLLDGSQTALVSSSSDSAEGVVSGLVNGGGDYDVSIALVSGGISEMQRSQIFTVNDGTGKLADGGTQLQSISQLYDSNGIFALDTPQALTMHGNGADTEIMLDGQMTLDNLAASLQNAMVSGSGLEIDNSRVGVANTVQTSMAGMGGYLEITSGFVGEQGGISFSSDQKVIDALGLSTSREAVNSKVELKATDNFGNTATSRTEQNVASGLLEGVDVHFNSQSAQIAGTGGIVEGLRLSTAQSLTVSVASTGTTLTLNITEDATAGWTMDGIARSMNDQIVSAIGNGDVELKGLSASVVDGEIRLSYDKPASAAASIGNTIGLSGATTGAKLLGFIDGSYSGFVDGKKDTDDVVFGFSRYAATSVYGVVTGGKTFLLNDGAGGGNIVISLMTTIGSSTGTVADMVLMSSFQADANAALATTQIRVDQVGSSMVFTSLRVGNENRNNLAAFTSMVTLSGINASADKMILDKLGLSEGTAKGSGDANFKMRVLDKSSQFQIGAGQGETMNVGISNLTSKALGIDNIDLTSVDGASKAMGMLDKAIDQVSSERSKLGAYQNRLDYAINNLRNSSSNLRSAESRIRDTDIAMEMIEFTRNQITSQSGTAMLAQANMVPQGMLSLLGNL